MNNWQILENAAMMIKTLLGAVGPTVALGTRGLAIGAHEAINAQIACVGANAIARLAVGAACVCWA
jgi:hypothetical protein